MKKKKIDIALQEGYANVFEKENKRTDSFSAISYVGVPYFSLNFNGSLHSVSTFSHELGHSLHTMYAKTQPFLYYEYSLFLAEIVSKVNELLVWDFLYAESKDKEERIPVLETEIQKSINSLIGQVKLTEFENILYQKKKDKISLSAEDINQIYLEITKKYHPGLVIDSAIQYNWESVQHLYLYNAYYFWNYAMGLAIAQNIVSKLKQSEIYKDKYIDFLKVGGIVSIKDALDILGIDLDQGNYIEKALQRLKGKIKILEKELER